MNQSSPMFLSDIAQELKRIEWPARPLVIKATLLVVVIVIVSSVFVGAWDGILTKMFFLLKGIK